MDAHKQSVEAEKLSAWKNRWDATRWIVLLLLFFMAGVLNWYAGWSGRPYLRFGRSGLRALATLAVLVIPWFAFFLTLISRPFRRAWARVVLLTILVPVMLVTIPVAVLELALRTSDQPIRTVEMDGYQVRLYQLDCGAPCGFAVGVDQERVLLPSIMLSKRLYFFDEAIDATVEIIGKNELRVTTLPYTKENPKIRAQVFHLKPYFFF